MHQLTRDIDFALLFNVKQDAADAQLEERLKDEGATLHTLSLRNCAQLTNSATDIIKRYCPRLVTLDLSGCSGVGDGAVDAIASIGNGATLRTLILAGTKLTDHGLRELILPAESRKRDSRLAKLKKLDLGATGVTDRGLKYVALLRDLRVLALRDCKKICKACLTAIGGLELTTLDLTGCVGVDDEAAAVLQHRSALRVLDLSRTGISKKALQHLRQSELYNLKRFGLRGLGGRLSAQDVAGAGYRSDIVERD